MPYDSFKHYRRSIRLRGYDYTQAGAYFVTLLAHNRECMFGDVVNGEMRVNALGQIAAECWDALPVHFSNVELDGFVVMPNHVHGIIVIVAASDDGKGEGVGATRAIGKSGVVVGAQHVRATHASPLRPRGPQSNSIGAIIGSFKSAVTKRVNETRDAAGAPVWHRNYYEHIIRSEKSLEAIRRYIENNPANWVQDEENPRNVKHQP